MRASEWSYQHVDFVPTLLELLGRPAPEGVDGVSAFAASRPSKALRFSQGAAEYVKDPASGLWRVKRE